MSFPTGKANANNKKYGFPVTPFSRMNDSRIANFFRLRNIENDLNDFIKFQEAEHARFMQYAGDMIFRSMYVPFHATYANHPQYSQNGVTIAAGATTKVPVACRIQVHEDFNPDYYLTAWLQTFNTDIGGVARITLNEFTHNTQNSTVYIEGSVFVFNPKTSAITVKSADVGGVMGKDLQKAWRTFSFNNYNEKQ